MFKTLLRYTDQQLYGDIAILAIRFHIDNP